QRGDMPKRSHLYNDGRHVFVVEVGDDGTPGATRVFRLADGSDVKGKDFSAAYQKRVRMQGSTVLVADSEPRGVTLRLYDILAGKDAWKAEFPAGSHVLQPEADGIGGVVEPDGKVT